MATIYDVATLAGVSPATVSRVFNGVTVSPEKAEQVRHAAAELQFTPNRTARTLRRQSSEVIALIIPDIENPFFTALARGVEDRAQSSGYSVVLCNSDEQVEKEARYIDIAVSENMAGVILAPASDHTNLDALISRRRPIVGVDRSAHGYEIDAVLADNAAGGRVAAETLFNRGHARVACITGPADVETSQKRAAGWRDVFETRNPDANPDTYLRYSNYRIDGGWDAMAELMALPTPPDAVFVANNLMAVGALRQLASTGKTPDAVDLVSFGHLPFATLKPRGVSIVELPARQLGITAATLLIDRINGDDQPARTVIVPSSAVAYAESTAESASSATLPDESVRQRRAAHLA